MFEQFDALHAIFAIAAIYTVSYQLIADRLVDRSKIKSIQEESKRLQKEFAEASKKNDQKKLDEINKEYEKFMPKMMEMSFMQLKPLIFVIPALAILTPFLHETYSQFVITLPFPLPVVIDGFGRLFTLDISGFLAGLPYWRATFGAKGWFWVCVIAISLSLSLIRWAYNKIKGSINPSSPPAAQGPGAGAKSPELNAGLAGEKKGN